MTEAAQAPTTTPPTGETPMAAAYRDVVALNAKYDEIDAAIDAFNAANPRLEVPHHLRTDAMPQILGQYFHHFKQTELGFDQASGNFNWVPAAGWARARQKKANGELIPPAFRSDPDRWLAQRQEIAENFAMKCSAHRLVVEEEADRLHDALEKAFSAWSDRVEELMSLEPVSAGDVEIMALIVQKQDSDAFHVQYAKSLASAVLARAGSA